MSMDGELDLILRRRARSMGPFGVWSVVAICLFALTGCAELEVGTEQRPFTMYFVPSVDAEAIAVSADQITDYLEEQMSQRLYDGEKPFHIKSAIPTSYIAVIEAFGTGKADFAALNSFSYILARDDKGYPVDAVLSVVRGKDERTYKGQIITHVDSGIETLQDLNGRKFAFTDPASTGGYIMPRKLFNDRGVEVGEQVFGRKHDIVVTMVYQRQVDAGACYYSPPKIEVANGDTTVTIRDARAKVMTQFPDVADKVKILGFTEDIPNDPWILRTNIFADPALQSKLQTALQESLLEFASTPEGKEALEELYSISGLVAAEDATWDGLRKAVADAGLDLESTVAK